MKAALLALLGACALDQPTGPHVHIVVPEGVPQLVEYTEGANAWGRLGFVASFDASGLPPCPAKWYAASPPVIDCEIGIGIERVTWLHEKTGADGLTDTSTMPATVMIDSRWSDFALLAIAAHEAGHVLLDTSKHTASGVDAIMAPAGAEWFAQPADYALACDTIGMGCDEGPLIQP